MKTVLTNLSTLRCVLGILKRGGKIYAMPVADASSLTLLTALKTMVLAHSLVYTDSLPSYNILDVAASATDASITPGPS
ncbi:MAG: hypothetical protein ACYCS1_05950 [Gammaproteobacteria bacterium]